MEIYHSLEEAKPCKGAVIALGTFDGVHIGHQQVMKTAADEAARAGVPSLVVTFTAHPLSVLFPEKEPLRLATLEQKTEYIRAVGVDGLVLLPVTKEFLNESPEEFCRSLIDSIGPTKIVVGANFTYGKHAAGNIRTLKASMGKAGIPVRILDLVATPAGGHPVSSTIIRCLVKGGKMEEVRELLGHPFELTGEVVTGDRRGNTIGFATANLLVPRRMAVPPDGVYMTTLIIDGRELPSMTNIGNNPTFMRQYRRVETHVINWEGNLYGKTVSVRFYKRIRDEKKFASITELVDAMKNDEKYVLSHFSVF
ncbi:bifunctional riboflavin kinase/FAD synthetase [Anaeroglobus geminatus]|jgi:riboflavin kinase/FMN adenylyltransferase|uniref:Riboflavin biosynthesis protein n=1 Tax=Anaeroglobus geminatus F0357 TaxID=861450 RepID=G9YF91_9FIRM|nr:bifunctional riboflavin kinase/FAD synthetase [Anaeroglobus geminatus]EHM43259.1 riboflavin biosynthesis protein RibF [Anaeroglobus geminatus F0357]